LPVCLSDVSREQHNLCDYRHPLLLFKYHNQLLRDVFFPNRNVFDTVLNSTVSLGYPPTCNEVVIYLRILENALQNRPSLK